MMRAILTALRRFVFGQHAVGGPTAQPQVQGIVSRTVGHSTTSADRSERRITMNAAYEKLCEHLTSQNIGYWSRSEDLSICADFRGEVGTYRIFARIDADDSLFQVFGHSPIRVPVGSRSAIAEAVMRVNCGLKVGKFEMDYDEGDLRFQAAQILLEDDLDDKTIQRLIGTTMSMLNIYLPAILSVIYGNELPKDAIRHAEPGRFDVDESESGERRADE
jgi:hypothetical protein